MKKVSKVTIIISLLIIIFAVARIKVMHKTLNVVHTPVPNVINLKTKTEIHPTYFTPGLSPSTRTISLLLLQEERISKGGVIGTHGKGVVAIRFDDYQNIFGEKIFPLMVARGIPCSMSLISRFSTAQPWGRKTTWSEVRNWNRNGVEIWSHGTNHDNYTIKNLEVYMMRS